LHSSISKGRHDDADFFQQILVLKDCTSGVAMAENGRIAESNPPSIGDVMAFMYNVAKLIYFLYSMRYRLSGNQPF